MPDRKIRKQLRFSGLDFKVGFRMLGRYPGLTIVGTIALAFAIALGTVYFEALHKWRNPQLPIRDADRVVTIRNWDLANAGTDERLLNDFATWREELERVDDLGAAVIFVRNLTTEDRQVEPVQGAEVTASAFRIMGTAPLLGRTLTEQDEQPAEPPVVVLSHSLWRTRFASDPNVVGQAVRLGTTPVTVVGVMPEGFAFPVSERIWTPLRQDGSIFAPRTGPAVSVFGRLAPDATLEEAQAELDVVGARMSTANPETHKDLRPRVTGYAEPIFGGEMLVAMRILYAVNIVFLMLLAVVSANIATLVFARTAMRGWEITVRTALGATRGRIVTQLFIEALVLASVAALVGLLAARFGMRWGLSLVGGGTEGLPFWIDASLSWTTVLYTALLAFFGAGIVGILPALRLTRVSVQDALRSEGAARSGLRFGGFWTTVIVLQVAITVAFLPLAVGGVFESNRFRQRAEGIGADGYITAGVAMDREDLGMDSVTFAARGRYSLDELARRLGAEAGVDGVTFADRLPVMDQFKYRIEVDTLLGTPSTGLRVSTHVQVSPGFFDTFGTSVVTGRDFEPLDFETGGVLIVNESFVRYVLEGRNPIGQRVRIVGGEVETLAGEEWYEVVGVVRDFGWQLPRPEEQSAMYRPRLPTAESGLNLVARVSDPEAFGRRLRIIAADVDPTIRLTDVQPLTDVGGSEASTNWALTSIAWLLSAIVLMLSATGIHSLMSFTVSRRTREIGIRAALGAQPGRIVAGIFSRAFLQIGSGVLVGSALVAIVGVDSTRELLILLAADATMLAVGLTACAVPLRRALAINPTEALRAEA